MAQYYYGRDDNEYPIEGTVTISTKEYRNMVMELAEASSRCNTNYTECSQKDREIENLKATIVSLREDLKTCMEFIGKDAIRLGEYNTYVFSMKHEEC